MAKIFISHSQDDPNLDFFHRAFSGTEVKAIWMEFEEIKHPAWRTITKNVKGSSSLFVLLSEILDNEQYEHTQNWISFEVGLACMSGKHVWVFEPFDEDINFVVPYFTHLVKYTPTDIDHIRIIKKMVETHGLRPTLGPKHSIQCPQCQNVFNLLSEIDEFTCPSCRWTLQETKKEKLSLSDFI